MASFNFRLTKAYRFKMAYFVITFRFVKLIEQAQSCARHPVVSLEDLHEVQSLSIVAERIFP